MTLLELRDVSVGYGPISALKNVSMTVDSGEIVTLIGANGAGKTTTLKTISGLLQPTHGDVTFDGESIVGVPAHKLVARGIGHAPEGRGMFPGMTVVENLEMGAYLHKGKPTKEFDRVFTLFPRLKERAKQAAGTLSGGEQQMVSIGRALMSAPKLLLLDEPSMGLAPRLVAQIFSIVAEINAQGTTILLVEQNAAQALRRAHRAYILSTGEVVREGEAEALADDPAVRAAYLGVETEET
ncbi:MAG: branched-chain amino acid transport system ATP-binding protein [Actinomycetota bacterium]|jgi:branched-chain amino acid transport system ATP-binding protein